MSSYENMPLISIIIPVYKVEQFLPKCVDSVLAQTYKNLEIILVDDGSPDNCGKICDEYAKKDARVRVIHQQNKGVSGSRNAGLEIAKGEYIGFVDSDDYIDPDMYEYLYGLITKDNADMAMCNAHEDEGFHSAKLLDSPYKLIPVQEYFECADWMYVWNKLYKRELIEDMRFDLRVSCSQDELFNFELAKKNAFVALGDQAKYHYRCRQNPHSVSVNFRPSKINTIILSDQNLAYAKEHHWDTYCKTRSSAQFNHTVCFLIQLARFPEPDPASVTFLTGYIKQHFFHFVSDPRLLLRAKLFGLICCVHFNSARKVAKTYYRMKFLMESVC